MHSGDFLVSIGDTDVKWAKHEEAVTYIRSAGDELRLKIITPMDRNYLDPASKTSSTPKSSPSMQISPNGSVSTSSSTKSGRSKSGSWIFRKKNSSSKKKKQNSMVQGMYDRSEVTCRWKVTTSGRRYCQGHNIGIWRLSKYECYQNASMLHMKAIKVVY